MALAVSAAAACCSGAHVAQLGAVEGEARVAGPGAPPLVEPHAGVAIGGLSEPPLQRRSRAPPFARKWLPRECGGDPGGGEDIPLVSQVGDGEERSPQGPPPGILLEA